MLWRSSGSHYILKHEDGRRVVLPRHGTVEHGLLLDQLKDMGITWEEFQEAL